MVKRAYEEAKSNLLKLIEIGKKNKVDTTSTEQALCKLEETYSNYCREEQK